MKDKKWKILIFDEDTESGIISAFCERLQKLGEIAEQVSDWKKLEEKIRDFKPDAMLIDLMIPPIGLPADECGAGYTTGAYVYRNKIRNMAPNVPFAIFTAADTNTTRISNAIDNLKMLPQYRGTFEKGEDAEVILSALSGEALKKSAAT